MNLVYLNGSYLPPEEARLPVNDRGLAYGDGVFTTIKVSGGRPAFLRKHLARLARDAAAIRLGGPTGPPLGEIEAACLGLVSRLGMGEGVLKAVLTRGVSARGPSTRGVAGGPTVLVSASSGLPRARSPLRAVSASGWDRGPLAAHKTLNYLPSVLALYEAEEAGCDEAFFVRDGLLLEATVANLVGVVGGRALTPPLSGGVLGGVAREALLEEGVVSEGNLPIGLAGPLYCINSVRGVEPVARLDGHALREDPELRRLLDKALARRARLDGSP